MSIVRQTAIVIRQPTQVATARSNVSLPGSGAIATVTTALYSNLYAAAVDLSALRIVRVNSDGEMDYASSADASHAFTVLGLTTVAIATGAQGRAMTEGSISDDSWAWDTTLPIWLGTDGVLTQTPPETGFLLQVAIALTPTTIEVEIQEPTIL